MNNSTQYRRRILGIYRRVAGAALAFAIVLVPAVVATRSAQAQFPLYSFTGPPDGEGPIGGLVLCGKDSLGNDNLYGTTSRGGLYGHGTVFKVDTNGSNPKVLYNFGSTPGDGAVPTAALKRDAQCNLYGTTSGFTPRLRFGRFHCRRSRTATDI